MNIKLDTVSESRIKIICTVTKEEAVAEEEAVAKSYIKNGNISGFRKGKAPREAIARKYGADIAQDSMNRVISKYYAKAVKEKELKVYELIDVADVRKTDDGGTEFVATVDLLPEFTLPKYEGIPVDDADTAVTDEEVGAEVESMLRNMAQFKDFDADTVAALDDMLCISYTATVDGKPLAEVVPDVAMFGNKENSWCTVGSKYYAVPGITDGLAGKKLGDEFTVTVQFPGDFHKESLRGITAEYKITVGEGRHLEVPELDEAFLKRLELKSVDELKGRLRLFLESKALHSDRSRRINQISDYLLKSTQFEIPQAELGRRTEETLGDIIQYNLRRGVPKEELEKGREEAMKTAREQADSRMRSGFILDKIAEELEIKLSNEEFSDFVNRIFEAERLSEAKAKEVLKDEARVRTLHAHATREKTLGALLEKATPTKTLNP